MPFFRRTCDNLVAAESPGSSPGGTRVPGGAENGWLLGGAIGVTNGYIWYNNGEVSPHKLGYHLYDYKK